MIQDENGNEITAEIRITLDRNKQELGFKHVGWDSEIHVLDGMLTCAVEQAIHLEMPRDDLMRRVNGWFDLFVEAYQVKEDRVSHEKRA